MSGAVGDEGEPCAIWRPGDVAVTCGGGRCELPQPAAVTPHDPDLEPLVAAGVAEERDPLPVGGPARPDRAIAPVRQLVDAVTADRRDEDLVVAGPIPGERDLTTIGREIDPAPAVIDVRRSDEILDRDVVEAGTERDRPEA